jgi:hypothetical protein
MKNAPVDRGVFHFLSKREIGFDSTDNTSHVVGVQPGHEIFSTFCSSLSMELIQALEADGVNHVALHPQLFVAFQGQRSLV